MNTLENSLLIGCSENSLDDIVKPDKKDEWYSTVRPAWFATDEPKSQKRPGLLKSEFSTDSGMFVGLR